MALIVADAVAAFLERLDASRANDRTSTMIVSTQ
jgi:hypothetical protein